MDAKLKVLVVDDNERILETVALEIGDAAEVTMIADAETALNLLIRETFDVVLTDYNLGHDTLTGLSIFRRANSRNPYVTACLMTGNKLEPIVKEVFDTFNGLLIEKPFKDGALIELLKRGRNNLIRRLEQEGKSSESDDLFSNLVADTPSMTKLVEQIKRCAGDSSLGVHLAGPTGTGKSTYAEIIHSLSGAKGKFVVVNCAELEDLAMSRLFGHMKGSFTGATNDHTGYVKEADGGTLFLDDFNRLSSEAQGKLLQVLQTKRFRPLGGKKDESSDFRIITAASISIKTLAEDGKFSPDLWFRVAGKILLIPGLSERKACIPKLVYRKLSELGKATNRQYILEPSALDVLISFSWDGNIRDLHNCLRSVCAELLPEEKITAEHIREDIQHRSGSFGVVQTRLSQGESFGNAVTRFQKELILDALRAHRGSMTKAAKALGMPRTSLITKCESLKIVSVQ